MTHLLTDCGFTSFFQDKEFIENLPKSRFELSKDINDENYDNKETNNKLLPQRPQKQFEQNNDSTKVLNVSSTSKTTIT